MKPSAPLYVPRDEIDWDKVKEYISKLKAIYWTDVIFTVRVPGRITDHVWTQMFNR